jgi:dimethylglycine dehydrogenase
MVERPNSVSFQSLTEEMCGFNVAGPKSRELLSRMTQNDLSNDNWKFMRSRTITIAGIDAIAIRVSFTGDLGWEIYVKTENQLKLYEALLATGLDLGVRPVGGRSLLSLRVEKGYGSWGREYSPEYWPHEVGLERLIKLDKPEFLGKEAYLKIKDLKPRERLVVLEVNADQDADPAGGEPVFLKDGTPVGRVTSGAYGYTCDKSLAICMIETDYAVSGNEFHVAVIGQNHEAVMLAEPPFDPLGTRLRA